MYVVREKAEAIRRVVDRLKGKGKPNHEWFQVGTATLEIHEETLADPRFKGLREALEKFAAAYMEQVNRNPSRSVDVVAIHIHGIEIHREYGDKGSLEASARLNRKRSRTKKENTHAENS